MASIAIIGSGISGLGAAYLLNPHHDITVYEKAASVGGHTRTVEVNYRDRKIPVDTGFIVYNEWNYPQLVAMFKHLKVRVKKSDMTFAITVRNGQLEWGAENLNTVFGQRSNLFKPSFYRLLNDVRRFNRDALALAEKAPTLTLSELVLLMKLGDNFLHYYILPIGGAIWSMPPDSIREFPALSFLRFFKNHGLLATSGQPQWYTVDGGAQEYVTRLTAGFTDKIKVNCGVVAVRRQNNTENNGVHITDTQGQTRAYDRVVFACHADQALAMLSDASDAERSILGAFRYQSNRMVLHCDERFMPKRKRCWASWVYHAGEALNQHQPIGVTYWMNRLQTIDANYPLFVTLNPAYPVRQELIFDQHDFTHPIFTTEAIAAQATMQTIQGVRNSWFCGAYLRNGFHEDGLQSAVNVAAGMDITTPWG